jgi:hypothetical protein
MKMGTSKCDKSPLSTMRALGGCAGVLVGFFCMEVALSKKEFHASCRAGLHGVEQLHCQGCRPRAGNTVQATASFRTQAMSVAWAFMQHFSSEGPLLVQQLGRTQPASFYLNRLFCAPSQKQELSAQYR